MESCSRYFLVILDEATSLAEVICVGTKAEATAALIIWIKRQQWHFIIKGSYKVKTVTSFDGMKFVNIKFKHYYEAGRIVHIKSNPYKAYVNSPIEIHYCSLKEITSAVLKTSGLSRIYYWKYGMMFAKV